MTTTKEFTDLDRAKGASSYMYYTGIPTFLRCEHDTPENADIGIIGVPYSGGNWIERTQYLAPRAIRDFSMGFHRSHRAFKINPFELCRIRDLGDVDLSNILDPNKAVIDIQKFYKVIDQLGTIPVSIGGDHSITLPILRALGGVNSSHKGPIGLIHLDAHVDAYGPVAGIKEHCGSMFMIALEEGLIDPRRTIQIGIRGAMGDLRQDDWAHNAGYRIIGIDDFDEMGVDTVIAEVRRITGEGSSGPTYISWDLDVLDPAYAPAVADPETGGISIKEAVKLIRGLRGLNNIAGADIVCYVPHLDATRITALNASSILHELVTIIADGFSSGNRRRSASHKV
ncbi:MAG: arginase family protein [Nitrososphaeraceae archaeon]